MLRHGDRDPAVAALRESLASLGLLPALPVPPHDLADPMVFDEYVDAAVRGFQQQRGLLVDGQVGPSTERELTAARWSLGDRVLSHTIASPMSGDDIAALQQRLAELGYDVGRPNALFTDRLERVVIEFQRHRGLSTDGVFGPQCCAELDRIAPMATGGHPQYLRELAAVHEAGPLLQGKRIVIDPAHGGSETGWAATGLTASSVTFSLAERLRDRLTAAGTVTQLTRAADQNPSAADRAQLANETSADLVLSLHVDGSHSTEAGGIATFHFGSSTGNISSVGEALAQLVHRELIARTGMIDCRVHHRPWEMLRRTQMPAVHVELGYITNPVDRARLADPDFLDRVADGLVVAIKRLYLDGQDDRPTGTFSFDDLLAYERAMQAS